MGQLMTPFNCALCNSKHETPPGGLFYPNFNVQNQINTYSYLNPNELNLKIQIESSIKELEEVYLKYDLTDESVEVYFKQMEYEINLQRFKLKSQIDDLTEKLIDLVTKIKLKYKSELVRNNSKEIKMPELDFFNKSLTSILRKNDIELEKLEKLRDEIKTRQLELNNDLNAILEDMKMYEFKTQEDFIFDEFDILGKFVRKNDISDELRLDFKIITCHSDGVIKTLDLNQMLEMSFQKKHVNDVNCLQISLDNKKLVSGGKDTCLNVYSIDSGELLKTIQPSSSCKWTQIICLQTTSNNNEILGGCSDSFVYLWDLNTDELLKTFQGHTKPVICLQMLKPNCFISGSDDFSIKMWNLITKKCFQVLLGHVNSISCLKTLNKFEFASGSKDKTIRIWSNQSNGNYRCIKVLLGNSGWINDLALTSSNYLISGSLMIQIYDIDNDFECVKSFNPLDGAVRRIQLLPNNKILVCVNKFNLMEVWCLKDFKCLQTLKCHTSALNAIIMYYSK